MCQLCIKLARIGFRQCNLKFQNYLPLKKGLTHHLNKLKIPLPWGVFLLSLVEIGPLFLDKKIFIFCQWILLFRYHLPLEKGVTLDFNKLKFCSPNNFLCQVWLKSTQWFCRRRWKCEKFKDKAHMSFQLRWNKILTVFSF